MRVTLKSLQNILLVAILVVAATGIGYKLGSSAGRTGNNNQVAIDRTVPSGKPSTFSLFWLVWDDLSREFVDRSKLDPQQMVYGAIGGMVASAGDPYTVFLPPDQNKEAKQDLEGSFGGVGIQLGFKDSTLAVMSALPGTPAEKSGVKAGDLIVKIADVQKETSQDTAGITLPQAVNLIRGDVGTDVKLTLVRTGVARPFDVDLKREIIDVPTVMLKWNDCVTSTKVKTADCHIPVITVNKFGDKTDSEWDAAVGQVLSDKAAGKIPGLILDLRNNPGGYLDQAVTLASDFVTSGPIVWQQASDGSKTQLSVSRTARLSGDKLVVLVNGGSASAAEIFSGALREQAGATLIGEKTFGKGSVQQPEDLPDGSGLHVTITRWLLPSGKSIDKVGINPDIEIKNPDDGSSDLQLQRGVDFLLLGK